MKRKAVTFLIVGILLVALAVFLRESSAGTSVIWNITAGGKILLPLVLVSALIDSINPCAFSILLLTIAFLVSIGKLRSKILAIGGVYVLGVFIAYMAIGLGLLGTLHIFSTPHFMAKVGAGLLIILGAINLINEFFPNFPIKLKIPTVAHHKMAELMEKASLPTALVLGVLVGLCEFPCTGGPYLAVLGLLHDSGTYLRGFGYLILYNVVFVLPLLVILGLASDEKTLSKIESWQQGEKKHMRIFGGVAMIALGIIIYFL